MYFNEGKCVLLNSYVYQLNLLNEKNWKIRKKTDRNENNIK